MKKNRIAGLLTLAPLLLFAACTSSTPELSLESNWLSYTTQQSVPVTAEGEAIETLKYDVTFSRYESTLNAPFKIHSSEGTSQTVLSSTTVTVDGKSEQAYKYRTELNIKVSFSLNADQSETFSDSVVTETVFLSVAQNLRPIGSTRTVLSHVPLYMPSNPPKTLTDENGNGVAFGHYNYVLETDYSETNKAKIKMTNLLVDEEAKEEDSNAGVSEYNVSTKGKGSYFDNEQILFLLRGVNLSSSLTFRTIDPTTRTVDKVKIADGPTAVQEACKFKMGDTDLDAAIDAYEISLAYSKSNAGTSQKCVYAKKVGADGNVYRNALLRYEQPVLYSHGTLVYTLSDASFSALQ